MRKAEAEVDALLRALDDTKRVTQTLLEAIKSGAVKITGGPPRVKQ